MALSEQRGMCGVYHYDANDANQAERDAPAVVSEMDLYLSMRRGSTGRASGSLDANAALYHL